MDMWRTAVARLACPRCWQRPGHYCRTASGNRAHGVHLERWQPLAEAYSAGYLQGEADARA